MRFVLASSSPRRKELLESLGIEFETLKPEIDERQLEGEDPVAYAQRLSAEKAGAVAARLIATGIPDDHDALVIAADTIVLAADTIGVGGEPDHLVLLGKPETDQQARNMLTLLREYPHTVYTAFRVTRISPSPMGDGEGVLLSFVDDVVATHVTMRDYTDDEMEAYISSRDPFDKAGSYAIQNEAFHPVAEIDGCYTNVVGLPLCAVKRALAKFNLYGFGVTDGCDCPPYVPPETI
jgi:MAF protein